MLQSIDRSVEGGIDIFAMTKNSQYLISVESDFSLVKISDPSAFVEQVPILRPQDMHSRKFKHSLNNLLKKSDFFDDLINGKGDNDDSEDKEEFSISSDDY